MRAGRCASRTCTGSAGRASSPCPACRSAYCCRPSRRLPKCLRADKASRWARRLRRQQAAGGERVVANHFAIHAEPRPAREQPVVRILRELSGVVAPSGDTRRRSAHLESFFTSQPLSRKSTASQSSSSGCVGRSPWMPKSSAVFTSAGAENLLPQAVDRHARGQRIRSASTSHCASPAGCAADDCGIGGSACRRSAPPRRASDRTSPRIEDVRERLRVRLLLHNQRRRRPAARSPSFGIHALGLGHKRSDIRHLHGSGSTTAGPPSAHPRSAQSLYRAKPPVPATSNQPRLLLR